MVSLLLIKIKCAGVFVSRLARRPQKPSLPIYIFIVPFLIFNFSLRSLLLIFVV